MLRKTKATMENIKKIDKFPDGDRKVKQKFESIKTADNPTLICAGTGETAAVVHRCDRMPVLVIV